MKEMILFDELIIKISEDDWDFLCKNRFFSDAPDEEMLQSEFVTGTGITRNKKHLWNQASERFSEYIKDLKEIAGLDINAMATNVLTKEEKYDEFTYPLS